MYSHYNPKIEKEVIILSPGDFFSSIEDVVLSTVLGSCIAVAICETKLNFGGLNHFMLPGKFDGINYLTDSGKYGAFAMELLINDMLKKGGHKKNFVAKVFGGGSMFGNAFGDVPKSNIDFVMEYLKLESIPIIASDVGGRSARKIYFFTNTFKVLLKRFKSSVVEQEELQYMNRFKSVVDKDITLF